MPSAVGLSCCCNHPMQNQAGLHCQWLLRTYLPVMLLVPCKAANCLITSANRLSEVCNTISLLEQCSLQASYLFAVTCHAEKLHSAVLHLVSCTALQPLDSYAAGVTDSQPIVYMPAGSWTQAAPPEPTPHHVLPVVAQFSKQAGSAPQPALRTPFDAGLFPPGAHNHLCCCSHHTSRTQA